MPAIKATASIKAKVIRVESPQEIEGCTPFCIVVWIGGISINADGDLELAVYVNERQYSTQCEHCQIDAHC
jgi:hypothetical protein